MSTKKIKKRSKKISVEEVMQWTDSKKSDSRTETIEYLVDLFEKRCKKNLQSNEVFKVSHILNDKWRDLSKGLRRSVGMKIATKVKKNKIPRIEHFESKNNGTFFYRKAPKQAIRSRKFEKLINSNVLIYSIF